MRFDHLRIPVTNLARSRRWYVDTLGLKVEFEVSEQQMVALQDGGDFTVFLQEVQPPVQPNGCALWFQVTDVDATYAAGSARGRLRRGRRDRPEHLSVPVVAQLGRLAGISLTVQRSG